MDFVRDFAFLVILCGISSAIYLGCVTGRIDIPGLLRRLFQGKQKREGMF